MGKWIVLPLLFCLGAGLAAGLYSILRARRTMDTLEKMLRCAIQGEAVEKCFDESRLSRLETEFAHYLSASAASARNVARERDTIKTLIADISHQTKTPIANLLLYSELLQEEPLPESARRSAAVLHAQAERLRFLIDGLVKLSRLENGILALSPREAELGPLLEEVRAQYAAKAAQKGLWLRLEPADCRACFDANWTAEALGNLVDNAIKYTQKGGVTLSAREYELFTRVDVADTGPGIPEEEQALVFGRFARGQSARETEGVGIGLYLAREIAAGQGGYIKLSSEPGKGAVFSLFLPRTGQSLQSC